MPLAWSPSVAQHRGAEVAGRRTNTRPLWEVRVALEPLLPLMERVVMAAAACDGSRPTMPSNWATRPTAAAEASSVASCSAKCPPVLSHAPSARAGQRQVSGGPWNCAKTSTSGRYALMKVSTSRRVSWEGEDDMRSIWQMALSSSLYQRSNVWVPGNLKWLHSCPSNASTAWKMPALNAPRVDTGTAFKSICRHRDAWPGLSICTARASPMFTATVTRALSTSFAERRTKRLFTSTAKFPFTGPRDMLLSRCIT
mmetsp:Transcript_137420/g.325480  ORF Transcript_137420/g.325480 Transcript_137420/m.325480 type:complete len:255 (+) Transcript_137420:989-1753(+)